MARHDPPHRAADIDRVYRRLERAWVPRPRVWATRLNERLPSYDGFLVIFCGTLFGGACVFLADILGGNMGRLFPLLLVLPFFLSVLAVAFRHWVRIADASPYAYEADGIMRRASADPRLMAVVRRWLRQSQLGSLSDNQIQALEAAMDRLTALRAWESKHAQIHDCLDAQHGLISELRAEDLARTLPAPSARGVANRL